MPSNAAGCFINQSQRKGMPKMRLLLSILLASVVVWIILVGAFLL